MRLDSRRLQEFGVYAVLLTIPLFRLGTEITGVESLTPAKIFIGSTYLIWAVNILIRKEKGPLISLLTEKTNLFLLLLLVFTFMSLTFSRHIQDETIAELSLRIKTFLLYFLIIGTIQTRRTFKIAIAAFLIGSLVTTAAGLYEAGTGDSFFKESYRQGDYSSRKEGLLKTSFGGKGRVQGLYSDAGFHAHAMVIFIGLAIPWVFYARSRKFQLMMAVLVTAYIVNLIGTGARVGWVSAGCALGVFLLFMQHRHKFALWAISVLSVIVIFLISTLNPYIPTTERLTMEGDVSWDWRIDTAKLGFEMIRDNPVLGVGTGNYLVEYFNYLEHTPNLSRFRMGPMHDSYLQVWIENGTAGFLALLAFMAAMGFGLLRVYLDAKDREMKILALGLLTSFAGYAVEFSGVPVIGQELGWIVFGLSVAFISINRREQQTAVLKAVKAQKRFPFISAR